MWLKIFGAVVVLVGIIFIFDGERIINVHFADMTEKDNAKSGIKILGTLLAIVGAIIIVI